MLPLLTHLSNQTMRPHDFTIQTIQTCFIMSPQRISFEHVLSLAKYFLVPSLPAIYLAYSVLTILGSKINKISLILSTNITSFTTFLLFSGESILQLWNPSLYKVIFSNLHQIQNKSIFFWKYLLNLYQNPRYLRTRLFSGKLLDPGSAHW